jgi:hypothetical protein
MRNSARFSGGLSAARSTGASALIFAFFLLVGTGYIIAAKSLGVPALWTTAGPLLVISIYAVLLSFARYLHLRDDQAGDNLYYLGFLYTLTSLGVSLWQFSTSGGAESIVTNFGIAVSSTILGVALRVIFGQMRQDPLEVERVARLELAEASRRVRQELDATVFELSGFRRATQQSLLDSMTEIKKNIEAVSDTVTQALQDLPHETLQKLSNLLVSGLERGTTHLEKGTSALGSAANEMTETLRELDNQLKAMKTPDGIIEIKLQPTIRGLTKALKDLSERLGNQVEQLQSAVSESTAASQESSNNSKETLDRQNRNLEQIVSLLSAAQVTNQSLIDQLTNRQQRSKESEAPFGSMRPTSRENPIGLQSVPAADPAAARMRQPTSETTVSSGRWPWFRKQ